MFRGSLIFKCLAKNKITYLSATSCAIIFVKRERAMRHSITIVACLPDAYFLLKPWCRGDVSKLWLVIAMAFCKLFPGDKPISLRSA